MVLSWEKFLCTDNCVSCLKDCKEVPETQECMLFIYHKDEWEWSVLNVDYISSETMCLELGVPFREFLVTILQKHTHTQMLKYDPLLYCRQWLLYSQEWLIIFKNGEILLINKDFLWSICARNMMEKHFLIFKCLSNCQELYTAEIMIIKNKCEGCRRRIVVRDQRERRKK